MVLIGCEMIHIGNAVLLMLILAGISVPAWAAYVGDDILTLTTLDFGRANGTLADARVSALLKMLKISQEEAAVFPRANKLELIKVDAAINLRECENKLIIAKGDIKVTHSNGCILISSGSTEVSFVSRSIIVAEGRIEVAHDASGPRDASGLYVTKREFELSHGRAPYIYAVGGHDPRAPGMTTFNTPLKPSTTTYSSATHNTIEPIFRDEPRPDKKDIGKSLRLDASEFIRYSGERCVASKPDNLLFMTMLPYVRKTSSCQELKSATVTCVEGREFSQKTFVERWTFDACGSEVNVRFQGQRFIPSKSGGSAAIGESIMMESESAATSRPMSTAGPGDGTRVFPFNRQEKK